jgi:hypothetical protein
MFHGFLAMSMFTLALSGGTGTAFAQTNDGYGLSLESFTVDRAAVPQYERLTVQTNIKNLSPDAFPGGQIGAALVNNDGDIAKVIGSASFAALGPNKRRINKAVNCTVLDPVAPGQHLLRIVIKPTDGEWSVVAASINDAPSAIPITVTAGEANGGGHGLSVERFTVDKATVSQYELFTVQSNVRNIGLDAFPGGQLGAALVNNNGDIVEVIDTTDIYALNPNQLHSNNTGSCAVPKTASPGKYRLRIVTRPTGGQWRAATLTAKDAPSAININVTATETKPAAATHFSLNYGSKASASKGKGHSIPRDSLPLAIRMAEAKIERVVYTPEKWLASARENAAGKWDKVELINTRELTNGQIAVTLHYAVGQEAKKRTHTHTAAINGPKNTKVTSFGAYGGENEELSAYDAQLLIDQCKEWYASDPDYRRIIDIIEREVVATLQYDWESYHLIINNGNKKARTYEESIKAGVGTCGVYARLTKKVLTDAGYQAEYWNSPAAPGGGHAWNHVAMPNGKTLYIDATWYDNAHDNNPAKDKQSPDSYCPWYVTYDKNVFERGVKETIKMHGAWDGAREWDDGSPKAIPATVSAGKTAADAPAAKPAQSAAEARASAAAAAREGEAARVAGAKRPPTAAMRWAADPKSHSGTTLAIHNAEARVARFAKTPNATAFTLGLSGIQDGTYAITKEKLSASEAQKLIDQCKEWYKSEPEYRKIADIVEREVLTKLKYDWYTFLNNVPARSFDASIKAGLGVCDYYAELTRDVLTAAGYKVEKWESPKAKHAWNHVILPNGKTIYIDATWYDNTYENHPTEPSPDLYCPWFITYDKKLFERGLKGTTAMHAAWPQSRRSAGRLVIDVRD